MVCHTMGVSGCTGGKDDEEVKLKDVIVLNVNLT